MDVEERTTYERKRKEEKEKQRKKKIERENRGNWEEITKVYKKEEKTGREES